MKKILPIFVLLLCFAMMRVNAQLSTDPNSCQKSPALDIYLDCAICDMNHIRENFTLVNYVSNRQDADVHIMIHSFSSANGGEEIKIVYIGKNKFQTIQDTSVFYMAPDLTMAEYRYAILEKLKLGLVPFLLKTDQSDNIYLSIRENITISNSPNLYQNKDKWRNWRFYISGSFSLSGEKSRKQIGLNSRFHITKITSKHKLESRTNLYYQEIKSMYDIDGTTISLRYFSREFSSLNMYVKSFGEHWSIGGLISSKSSSYSNLEFQIRIEPAIEYNLFKYSQSSDKQLCFLYSAGYEHSNYHQMTIYDRNQNDLFRQNLSIDFSLIETWGNIYASVYGSNYLNDFSCFMLGSNMMAQVRIKKAKGFSFTIGYGINMHRNQITLVKDPYSSFEELLTMQREIQTDFSYRFSFGISFTFGSKFNNVVNPRFGQ